VNLIFAVFEHTFGKGQSGMGCVLYDRSILQRLMVEAH
jgi:hypothetical protein